MEVKIKEVGDGSLSETGEVEEKKWEEISQKTGVWWQGKRQIHTSEIDLPSSYSPTRLPTLLSLSLSP